jgi:ABC-type transporter Mla subunit MlaD
MRVNRLDEDNASIIEKLSKITRTQERHGRKLNALGAQLVALERNHGQKLDDLGAMLGVLETRVEAVERRLDEHSGTLGRIEGTLGLILERLPSV